MEHHGVLQAAQGLPGVYGAEEVSGAARDGVRSAGLDSARARLSAPHKSTSWTSSGEIGTA
jgi:hypothetical protein